MSIMILLLTENHNINLLYLANELLKKKKKFPFWNFTKIIVYKNMFDVINIYQGHRNSIK